MKGIWCENIEKPRSFCRWETTLGNREHWERWDSRTNLFTCTFWQPRQLLSAGLGMRITIAFTKRKTGSAGFLTWGSNHRQSTLDCPTAGRPTLPLWRWAGIDTGGHKCSQTPTSSSPHQSFFHRASQSALQIQWPCDNSFPPGN